MTNTEIVFRRDTLFSQGRRHSGEWNMEDFTFQSDLGIHRYKYNEIQFFYIHLASFVDIYLYCFKLGFLCTRFVSYYLGI